MTDKIFLGIDHHGKKLWLEKHEWACGWYWAFGYIGNRNLHMHISALIDHPEKYAPDWVLVSEQFESTWMTQGQWWIMRDLFLSAYALKKAAAAYCHGGHQTASAKPYRVICPDQENRINVDLGILLDNIWQFVFEAHATSKKRG